MRLALDRNRYTNLCRINAEVLDTVEAADQVWLAFISSYAPDLLSVARDRGTKRFCGGSFLRPGVDVLYADEQTTHHYANLYRHLRNQGTPIPTNDMWIAALVLQHSLTLCDRDAHFDALPQLPRV